jgi:hypothetical protein
MLVLEVRLPFGSILIRIFRLLALRASTAMERRESPWLALAGTR